LTTGQRHTSQFAPRENFVGTGAFGPWMDTTDEIPDISKRSIATRLSGVEMQAAPISDLVFDVPALIAYYSPSASSCPATSSSPAPLVASAPIASRRSG
jgi:2-keto-4-pentenoate hydratase/2-oxohepta-3-ene-1,7-dioic acid hydratase in catechol pathway